MIHAAAAGDNVVAQTGINDIGLVRADNAVVACTAGQLEQIGAFGLLWSPFIPLAVWGLVGLELCAGLAVIANRRWGLWLVVALLALFIPVLGYGIAIGLDISCGCLGRADLGSLPEAIVRDLLLLTLAGALLRHSRPVLTVSKEQ